MSGGHFNYDQYKIGQIADEIEHVIFNNENNELDEFGCSKGNHFNPEIIDRLKIAVKELRRVEIMAGRIDWLLSGDDGEDSFIERWDIELKDYELFVEYKRKNK